MIKKLAAAVLALFMTVSGFAQAMAKKPEKAPVVAGAVDKAHLQKVWDGWATLDVPAQKQYYAQGPHVFFDIAPLKYGSWDEFQAGSANLIEEFKSARFTVNDDVQIHKAGDADWVTSTIAYEMIHKSGKRDMGNFRWTAVFEKQGGKWLIVHEHVSEPVQ